MNLFAIYASVYDIIIFFGTTAKVILYGRLATTVSIYNISTLCIIFQKEPHAVRKLQFGHIWYMILWKNPDVESTFTSLHQRGAAWSTFIHAKIKLWTQPQFS